MKVLSHKQAKVLAAFEMNADRPVESSRKETGLQDHSIRYHLHVLRGDGVIRRAPVVDLARAGFMFFGVYFSPAVRRREVHRGIVHGLLKLPEIVWLAEFGGDYRYGMALCGRSLSDIEMILAGLAERFPNLFGMKSVACQLSSYQYPRKYLPRAKPLPNAIVSGNESEQFEIDELDGRILGALTALDISSRRQLAQFLGVPLTSIDYRVKRLHDRGLIKGYVYSVDPSKIGRQPFVLLVYGKGMHPDFSKKVLAFAEQHSDVIGLYRCLGWWDFELNVEAESHLSAVAVGDALFDECNEWINTIKVLPRLQELKRTMVPFASSAIKRTGGK